MKPLSDVTGGKVNGQVLLSLLEVEAKAPGITLAPGDHMADLLGDPAKTRVMRFKDWFTEAVKNFGK